MSPRIDHADDVEPFDVDAYEPDSFKVAGYLERIVDGGGDR